MNLVRLNPLLRIRPMHVIRALAGPLLIGILLGGVLAGVHHHATSRPDDGCAVCTLAHTSADTPAIVSVPAAVTRPLERLFVALLIAPGFESRTAIASRAPPLG
jgi:hypothetical protein